MDLEVIIGRLEAAERSLLDLTQRLDGAGEQPDFTGMIAAAQADTAAALERLASQEERTADCIARLEAQQASVADLQREQLALIAANQSDDDEEEEEEEEEEEGDPPPVDVDADPEPDPDAERAPSKPIWQRILVGG